MIEAAPVQVQACLVWALLRAVHIDFYVLLFKNVFTKVDGTVKLIVKIAEGELLRQTSLVQKEAILEVVGMSTHVLQLSLSQLCLKELFCEVLR